MGRFDAARRAALMQDLLGVVLGRSSDLLPFDEVREGLRLRSLVDRGVQEVPLAKTVGTLGREREFTRAFLPREESLRKRWEDVKSLAEGPEGFPPVELYKVGEAYFVVDGHHRVSVQRSLGASTIEARVKEFPTPVPLAPDETIEDVLLKRGLAEFLEATRLVPASPDEFRTTIPNGYESLLDHINTHRWYLGCERQREATPEEAIESWRDGVYRPMVDHIRTSGILKDFPGYTETDLYLYVMNHLHHLRNRYGREAVAPEGAVAHFAARRRRGRLRPWIKRLLGMKHGQQT
jgi:hypothetical protein